MPPFRWPLLPGRLGMGGPRLAHETGPLVTAVDANSDRIGGGTSVTITGGRFRLNTDGAAPGVTFGGTSATSIVVVSATTITCTTPAHAAGLVDVAVTIGSQTGTLYGGFTYYGGTISSLSPAYGPIAGGTTVAIVGLNFVTGSTITFGGVAATSVVFIDDQHYSCVTPAHALGHVDVVITEPSTATVTGRSLFQYTLLTRTQDIRRNSGINIRTSLGNAPGSCTFRIDGQTNAPVIGEEIQITDANDGGRVLFAGNIQRADLSYDGVPSNIIWDVTAVDFTALLNRRRPSGLYLNVSASTIVSDLVSRFAAGFTANHVQTNLARITIGFDGTQDFTVCLQNIATAIGGGHWYIDYTPDVHFFHVIPPNITLPSVPQTQLRLGPGSAPTVAQGALIPAAVSFTGGYYAFRTSFVYSNGSESALGPLSTFVAFDGLHQFSFTNLAIGANPGGGITCTKRRLYYTIICVVGGTGQDGFCEVQDNATTAFTCWFGDRGASIAVKGATNDTANWTLWHKGPGHPYVAPPAGATQAPTAAQGSTQLTLFQPYFENTSLLGREGTATVFWGGGTMTFVVTNLYRDGTESLPSVPAAATPLGIGALGINQDVAGSLQPNGSLSVLLSNIPIGTTINSVDVIGRKVYACFGLAEQNYAFDPTRARVWYFINDNTTVGPIDIGPLIEYAEFSWPNGSGFRAGIKPDTLPTNFNDPNQRAPQWPNPDGPSLENAPSPDSITDASNGLLHQGSGSQALVVSTDKSQVRNRVGVRGAGTTVVVSDAATTTLAAAATKGTTALTVKDATPFNASGDQLTCSLGTLAYTGVVGNVITLAQPLAADLAVNTPVTSTIAAQLGAMVVSVADLSLLNPGGGRVYGPTGQIAYVGVSAPLGSGQVYLEAPLPSALHDGDVVNIYVEVDDVVSQEALGAAELDVNGVPTDGIYEYLLTDTSLVTYAQLYMRAYAEIELFGRPIITVSYATRDAKTTVGSTVHIDLSTPPVKGDFLIQDVTIDQVHDEIDTLFPRRTVRASSVRFDLNDLLRQVVAQSQSGTPPGSGVSGSTPVAAAGDAIPFATTRKPFWAFYDDTTVAGGSQAIGTGLTEGSGGSSVVDATTSRRRFTTVAGDLQVASLRSTTLGQGGRFEHTPTVIFDIFTGSDITTSQLWAGLFDNTTLSQAPGNSPLGTLTRVHAALRYAPGGTDAGWTASVGDGTSQVTSYVAPIAASTRYALKIQFVTPTQVIFYVNGIAKAVTIPSNAGAATKMIWEVAVTNDGVGFTRFFDFVACYGEYY